MNPHTGQYSAVLRAGECILVILAAVTGVRAGLMLIDALDTVPARTSLGFLPWIAEVLLVCAVAVLALFLGSPARGRILWIAAGLIAGLILLGGFSIGPAFAPTASFLAAAAFVGDLRTPRSLARHLPIALFAVLLQVILPVLILSLLR